MSIPLLTPNSVMANITLTNSHVRADHSTIALAGQMGQQAVKNSKTDTVTISKKAVQMASSAKQTNSQGSKSKNAVDQAPGKKEERYL